MPFLDKEKEVIITKTTGDSDRLEGVSDIGPAEGFEGFICFWKKDEELPFYLIPMSNIDSMKIKEPINDNS